MTIKENFSLASFSGYKTGGPADFFISASNLDEIKSAAAWAKEHNQQIFILGGGTNILFSDEGYRGLVIKIDDKNFWFENNKLYAGAGAMMPDLVESSIKKCRGGLEWAGGLPGTLGGAIRGNAGCFGGEIKDNVESVTVVDYAGKLVKFNNQDCRFSYRHSRFKVEPWIVVEAILNLKSDQDKEKLTRISQDHINYRCERQPLEYPNCGSVFKNFPVAKAPAQVIEQFKALIKTDPFPVIPTAALIDQAGLKGHTIGGAQVSEKHPNFIINLGSATSADIFSLRNFVVDEVKKKFGVNLETEVEFLI